MAVLTGDARELPGVLPMAGGPISPDSVLRMLQAAIKLSYLSK